MIGQIASLNLLKLLLRSRHIPAPQQLEDRI
jgi:hypothetical protein